MGNHQAGRAMVHAAVALAAQRDKTGQTAIEILDIACKEYRGCDAEFDDDTYPPSPFAQLLLEAFQPGVAHEREDEDWWYANVVEPFSKRYGLC